MWNIDVQYGTRFDCLNYDCIEHILNYLSLPDLVSVAQLGVRFTEAAIRTFRVTHSSTLTITPLQDLDSIYHFGEEAQHLHIIEKSWANPYQSIFEQEKYPQMLRAIDRTCLKITALSLQIQAEGIQRLMMSNFFLYGASQLKELTLVVPRKLPPNHLLKLLCKTSNIRTLHVFFHQNTTASLDILLSIKFPQLENFSFTQRSSESGGPNKQLLAFFLQRHQKLTDLSIDADLNVNHLVAIGKCRSLLRLWLHADTLTPAMIPILRELPIDEFGTRNVAIDTEWQDVLHLPGLREFSIGHNEDAQFEPIVDNYIASGEQFKQITAVKCKSLSDVALRANFGVLAKLIKIMPDLETIQNVISLCCDSKLDDEIYMNLVAAYKESGRKKKMFLQVPYGQCAISAELLDQHDEHIHVVYSLNPRFGRAETLPLMFKLQLYRQ